MKIACLGDSITYGFGISYDRQNRVWTKLLENALAGSEVRGFGIPGQALLPGFFAEEKYRASVMYRRALEFAPDAFTVLLGSNDSHCAVWKKDAFEREYRALLDDLTEHVRQQKNILLIAPPAVRCDMRESYGSFGVRDEVLKDEIRPLLQKLAGEFGTGFLDLYAATENRQDIYSDEVHPNEEGNRLIGELTAEYFRH